MEIFQKYLQLFQNHESSLSNLYIVWKIKVDGALEWQIDQAHYLITWSIVSYGYIIWEITLYKFLGLWTLWNLYISYLANVWSMVYHMDAPFLFSFFPWVSIQFKCLSFHWPQCCILSGATICIFYAKICNGNCTCWIEYNHRLLLCMVDHQCCSLSSMPWLDSAPCKHHRWELPQ